ncbi:MAG: hypothetical protein SGILL_003821 [Bacillariaceae sp.]
MQQILLTLEKRVKEGPGSLSMLEVEEFVVMSQELADEMKNFEYSRLNDAGSSSAGSSDSATVAATATIEAGTAPATETIPASSQPAVSASGTEPEIEQTDENVAPEHNEDGPAYDPSGGQGSLAKGTRNTYVIPNMDEMSPEEYRKALQESISSQQEERKKKNREGGRYGNRSTWDYLNNLTGESGVLKSDSAFDD